MLEDYKKNIEKIALQKKEVDKLFKSFKKKKPKSLDAEFHQLHDQAFQEIDCLKCANCCKTTSPIFRDVDIKRIAKFERSTEKDFIKNFLRMDEDGDYVLQKSPCYFLDEDNTCRIYEVRPLACKEYPHTDRKNMHQILDLTQKNTAICPAVAKIVDQLL